MALCSKRDVCANFFTIADEYAKCGRDFRMPWPPQLLYARKYMHMHAPVHGLSGSRSDDSRAALRLFEHAYCTRHATWQWARVTTGWVAFRAARSLCDRVRGNAPSSSVATVRATGARVVTQRVNRLNSVKCRACGVQLIYTSLSLAVFQ